MNVLGASLRRWFRAVELLIVGVLVMAAAFMVALLYHWDEETAADLVRHGLVETSNGARITQVAWEDQAERMEGLARLATVLAQAEAQSGKQGHSPEIRMREAGLRAAFSVIGQPVMQLSIARPDGRIWWSTTEIVEQGSNVFDRSYFQAIVRDGREQDVEGPLVGRMTGRRSIKFSFAARDAWDQLIGVVIISLNESEIQRVARTTASASPIVLTLFKHDGTILSSTSGNASKRIDRDQAWLDGINADVPVTEFGRSPVDDVVRFSAYVAIPRLDLLVGVGMQAADLQELREDHYALTRFLSWLALGCLVLLLTIAGGMVWRALRSLQDGLRQSATAIRKDFLHQIADRTSDMIAILDHEYRYLYANAAAETVLGVHPDALVGKLAGRLVHRDDRPIACQGLQEVRDPGVVNTVVFRVESRGNPTRWVEARLNPIRFEQPDSLPFRGTFMIVRDVTAQRRANDALSELRAELDVIARTGPGTLYQAVIQPDGHWGMTFPIGLGRLADTLHIDPETAGHDFLSLVHPEDLQELRFGTGGFDRAEEAALEYRWIDDGGRQRFIRDIGVVTTRTSTHIAVSGYLFDVTREVEQRQRLDRASRLLSLGQMAVGLAHELNQPLAAISMAAENGAISLEMGPAGVTVAQQKFERISALALRAGDIIEHIRQFGRPGKASGQPTDVGSVIDEACAVLHERIERAGITLTREVPASLPPVRATPGLLQQVLVNVIANACDALAEMPRDDNPRVRRIMVSADCQGEMVRVSIADTAGGIPEVVIQQIFEPFFTTKPVGQGTGLGLSVSFGIVQNFGGAINIHNRDGGAVFEIDLPVWAEARKTISFEPT